MIPTVQDVAEQGCVLVQNTNAALPMDFSKVRQIALIGPLINDSDSQCGKLCVQMTVSYAGNERVLDVHTAHWEPANDRGP